MVIIREFYMTRSDGVNLYRSYSDIGLQIRKVGTDEIYDDAVDVENSIFEYEETDIPIEDMDTEEIPAEELKQMIEEVL